MSIKEAQELKGLESRLTKLKAQKADVDREYADVCGRQSSLAAQIQNVTQSIQALKNSRVDLIVTEHAIIRFMERAMGLDLAQVKGQILATIPKSGNGKFPLSCGLKAVVKDGSVVTVE